MKNKIEIVVHYAHTDKRFSGDYVSVEVFLFPPSGRKVLLREYEDSYHDKGIEKAEAFADGFKYCSETETEVARTNVADAPDY